MGGAFAQTHLFHSGGVNRLFENTSPQVYIVGNLPMETTGTIWANANFEFMNVGTQSLVSSYIEINGIKSNTTTTSISPQVSGRTAFAQLSSQFSIYCGVTGNIPIKIGVSCPLPGSVWFSYYDVMAVGNLP